MIWIAGGVEVRLKEPFVFCGTERFQYQDNNRLDAPRAPNLSASHAGAALPEKFQLSN